MIEILYELNPETGRMMLKASGHAGYAERGKDIVCAAVSALMQTLAYNTAEVESTNACCYTSQEGPVLSVIAEDEGDMQARFELVADGLSLIAEKSPENVRIQKVCIGCEGTVDLQLFADGAGGDGAGDAGGEGAAAPVEMPKLRPAEERLARRSGVLKRSAETATAPSQSAQSAASSSKVGASGETGKSELDEEGGEGRKAEGSATEGDGSEGGEKKQRTPEERKKAFGELMQGEYREEAEALMQKAVEVAAQNLQASPALQDLISALKEKYGTDTDSLQALTEAVRSGKVKDDAYYEKLAMEKGVSVKTARELDKLESQNRQLTAQQQAVQQMERQRAQQEKIVQLQAGWNREEAALKQKYPDFEQYRGEFLENPETKQMLLNGVSMETAYRAMYFDRLVEADRAATAQQVQDGVVNRIQQRNARPGENGTRPGGAVQTKVDVSHMSRREMEELERRARRGEIITL